MKSDLTREFLEEMIRKTRNDILEKVPAEEFRKRLPPKERLEGLSVKERLQGLSPDERLEGLSTEEILAALPPEAREAWERQLKATVSSAPAA
jgi:hypothetical protein